MAMFFYGQSSKVHLILKAVNINPNLGSQRSFFWGRGGCCRRDRHRSLPQWALLPPRRRPSVPPLPVVRRTLCWATSATGVLASGGFGLLYVPAYHQHQSGMVACVQNGFSVCLLRFTRWFKTFDIILLMPCWICDSLHVLGTWSETDLIWKHTMPFHWQGMSFFPWKKIGKLYTKIEEEKKRNVTRLRKIISTFWAYPRS